MQLMHVVAQWFSILVFNGHNTAFFPSLLAAPLAMLYLETKGLRGFLDQLFLCWLLSLWHRQFPEQTQLCRVFMWKVYETFRCWLQKVAWQHYTACNDMRSPSPLSLFNEVIWNWEFPLTVNVNLHLKCRHFPGKNVIYKTHEFGPRGKQGN